MPELAALVLAAGRARRFGTNKLVAQLADGVPLGLHAPTAIDAFVDRLLVVVPGDGGATEKLFKDAGYVTLRCPQAASGMAYSLACGIRALSNSDACLVALADMPDIPPLVVAAIASRMRAGAQLVLPCCAGRDGHPVGFASSLYAELLALRGDRGARDIISRHAGAVQRIECADPGVLRDIDCPADLN